MIHCRTAKVGIDTSLHNREQSLVVSVQRFGFIKMLHTTLEPPLSKGKGFLRIVVIRVARTALVESHDDVGSDDSLCVHVVFRGEDMLRTVDVRAEDASVFGELSDRAQ